jgi:subtilisin family serine protease
MSQARQSRGRTADAAKERKFNFVPGQVLVRFREDAAVSKNRANLSLVTRDARQISLQLERLDGRDFVPGLRLARVAPEETFAAIEALAARPDVLYAEPNYLRHKNAVPNDPRYPELWGLKNTGQPVYSHPGTPGSDIKAEQAWDITTGSRSVVVGVVDEGIDINHPDLQANIWQNPGETPNNGVDDDANGFVDDVNGWDFVHNDKSVFDGSGNYPTDETDAHGTHVAGTLGAVGNNGVGVAGVSWQVSIMSLKFLGPNGLGTSADLLKALSYARTMKDLWTTSGGVKGANIRVLNNSYSGGGFSQAELDAIRTLQGSGILFVAAAGNESRNNDLYPTYPASYQTGNVLSVAASNPSDLRPDFTNVGPGTVNMAAPGEGILSTTPNGTYDTFDGTSMATPHVAGAAALLCTAFPNLSVSKLRALLMYSGDFLTTQNFFTQLSSGRRLNAFKALQAAAGNDTVAPGSVTGFQMSNPFFTTTTLSWVTPGDDGMTGQAAAFELKVSDTALVNNAQFESARSIAAPFPINPGSVQSLNLDLPWRHPFGFYCIRAVDEAGNAGPITCLPYSIRSDIGDPYSVAESAAAPLSTGGTALQLNDDDATKNYNLPFALKFFGQTRFFNSVNISTNGAIYAGFPPADDHISAAAALNGFNMIAGMWDDLRTDKRPGDDVYVVTPDPDRIIFRWQAVTFDTPLPDGTSRGENPVNFEIELRRDGTIQVRYGDGNQKLLPVVGIGGGAPEPYVVDSHTSETQLKNLTNAQTVTFSLRPTQPNVAVISGRVFDLNNNPLPDATVTLSGGSNASVQSGPDGSYAFLNLNSGSGYVVTASKPGFQFLPVSQSYPFLNSNVVLDFHAAVVTQVSGRVTDANGQPISGVVVTINKNGQVNNSITNASGDYDFGTFATAPTVTVVPSAPNLVFQPLSQTLNNPVGAQVINFTGRTPNPIDDSRAFIRQQYLDFLNREPDPGGWDFWTSQITGCGSDPICTHNRRIDVSAAFFIELEFQVTGYVVYRMHRAAFGTFPGGPTRANISFAQFIADRSLIVAGPGLPQSTIDFANAFMQRPAFLTVYPNNMSNADFVNTLFDKANLTPFTTERQQQIDAMNNSGKTRAQVLLDVIEIPTFKTREHDPAFVLMQYFGYLRRDPDQGGYDFWLNVLNTQVPGNFRGMVCAFLTSAEYQRRFGTTVTRTDHDCGP